MSTGTGVKVTAPVVSKKEMEKRVERVQKLRKLDCNKICFDCGERGPQSACTTFNVFVCMMCHGIHREFNHRVKSISMSTFDEAEVAGLEAGGNDVGRKYWLARFKETDFPIPDVNEPRVIREKRIRDFIRMKYIEKRWIPQQDEPEKKKKKKKVKKQESSDEEESDDSEEEREAAKKKAEKEARKAAKAAKKSKAARDSSPTPPLKQLTDVLPEFKDKLVVTDKKANGHEAEEEETEKKKKKKDKEGKKKKDATPATKAAPVADSGAKSSGGNLLDLDFLGGGGAAPVQQQQPAQASNSWDAFDSGSSAQAAPPASNEWATFGNGNGNGNGFASQSQSHQPVQQQQAPQPTPFTQTQQPQQTSLFDTGNPFASPPTQHHQLQQQPQAQASFQQSFQQPFQQPQQQQQHPQASLFAQQPQPTFQQTHHQQNPLTAHQPAINFVVPSVNSSQTSQSSSTDLFGFGSSTTSVTPQAQAPSSSPAITPSVAPSSQRRALDGDPFADIMSGTATSEFASAASAQQSAYNSNRSKSRYAVEGPGVGKPSSALAGMTGLHSTPGSNTAAAGSANAFAGLGGMGGMGQPQAAAAPASTTAAYGLGGMTAAPMSNPGVNAQLMAQQQMMAQQQAVLQQQLYAQVGPPAGAGGQYSPQQHQQVQLLYQQYMAQQQMMYMMAAQGRGFGGAAPAAAGGMAGFGGMAGMGGMGGGMPQSQAQQPPAAASNPFQF